MKARRGERGFTLIELAVALGLFAIVLVSISLVFDRALTSAGRSRFDQVAKTLAQEKLEEIRSLPFYVSKRTNTADVDILDRYFPGTVDGTTPTGATGDYDETAGVWTYTSTEPPLTPTGGLPFTRVVVIQFVVPRDDGTLLPIEPIPGYESNDLDLDRPVSDAMSVTVTVSWTSRGQPRSTVLDTVIANTRNEEPKVDASGSILGAQVSGLTFFDGSVQTDVLAKIGEGEVSFREVAEPVAQASADALDVVERDPATNVPLQDPQPLAGVSSATAPNAATGDTQDPVGDPLAAGTLQTVNDPFVVVASWGSANPAADTAARVSTSHAQNPEALAFVDVGSVAVHARDAGEGTPIKVAEIGRATGTVEERSTTAQATITATVDLANVTVWASREFTEDPDYQGTVLIDSIHVEAQSIAGSTTSSTLVSWQVSNLRIWDPDFEIRNELGEVVGTGAYVGFWTFGSGDVNPVVIPAAYAGTDPQGNAETSLEIVAGATVTDSFANAAQGISNASAAQKNVLSIATRDDITDAATLEPMILGLGDANSNVSYVAHEH